MVRLLGRGGMGTVYEAEHLESSRRVALKILSHSLDSPDARKRFLREGRLAASVNHPNCVYIFGTEEIEGTPAIAMELAPGGTLKERVKREGPLPVADAVDVILQIIAGLEAAQSIGVLHRDIKPSNCFIDTDGRIKVGDFGLSISTRARSETQLTLTGAFLGTPAFSSPEQLRGDELDVRSDIYSVGVTMYYLLTGRTPFEGENLVRLLATVLESAPEPPSHVRPGLPKELSQVILRCLAKSPGDRFKNYDELRDALWPFSSSAPVAANLGSRFMAGAVDFGITQVVVNLALSLWLVPDVMNWQDPALFYSGRFFTYAILFYCFCILYFAVPEARCGASLGKAVFGLRVTNLKRHRPGFGRSLLRAVIFWGPSDLFYWIGFAIDPRSVNTGTLGFIYFVVIFGSITGLFLFARKRNGLAALHDLASGTRVVQKTPFQSRQAASMPELPLPPVENIPCLGPYHLLADITDSIPGKPELEPVSTGPRVLLGYDA
ncbi:MAG: protein kinase, partial [Verrucomicrobiota bacterium]